MSFFQIKSFGIDARLYFCSSLNSINSKEKQFHDTINNNPNWTSGHSNQNRRFNIDWLVEMARNESEHVRRCIAIYLLIHIWLEFMLTMAKSNLTDEFRNGLTKLENSTKSSIGCLLKFVFTNLHIIPELTGLANLSDSGSLMKLGDKLDLCRFYVCFY